MPLHIVQIDGPIATVLLNRLRQRNAVNHALREELTACFRRLKQDDAIRAIILGGLGSAFCAGADVKEWMTADARVRRLIIEQNMALLDLWESLRKPRVSAVGGAAVGIGFLLAIRSDLVIATKEATFAMPERKLGIDIPDEDYHKARFGPQRASELLLECATLSVREGYDWGFVNQIVEGRDALFEQARARAERCIS